MILFRRQVNIHSLNYWRTFSMKHSSNLVGVPLSYIKVPNAKVNTDKSPLLIFHGMFGSKTNWRSISKHLVNRIDRDVYIFDLRNHGESPHVDGPSDLNAMANDIDYFMNNHEISKACLLGHSLGGRVVAQFAFNQPEKVEKLLLVDISVLSKLPATEFTKNNFFQTLKLSVEELPSKMELISARKIVFDKLMPLLKDKFIVDFFLLSLYKDNDDKIKWRFNVDSLQTLIADRLIINLDIKQPFSGDSFIIYGEKSNYVRKEDYDQIRVHLPAVQFISIPDAGHFLHIEKTNQFIDHVVNYLK